MRGHARAARPAQNTNFPTSLEAAVDANRLTKETAAAFDALAQALELARVSFARRQGRQTPQPKAIGAAMKYR
jgi:hypothetical protein